MSGEVTVEMDVEWPNGRRVVAMVESTVAWRRRQGPYVVDLIAGQWWCTCWPWAKRWPCRHAHTVAAHVGAARPS